MKRPRRYRSSVAGHAPASPPDHRQRTERTPQGADCFQWRPMIELVVGIGKPKREDVMERLELLYGRSKPDGATL
jgi:hypothetical protein